MTEPTELETERPAPYGNLLVPLVVVPALIVMVLVLVFIFFSSIVGQESSPRENLTRMLEGGKNESQQAAFNLVRQTLESWQARAEGRQPEWDIDEGFLPELHAAWERTHESDVRSRLVLALLLAGMGDGRGVERLVAMTRLPEAEDPSGELRFQVVTALGTLGPHMEPEGRELAGEALVELFASPDPGLVSAAVVALQSFPGPDTLEALRGMLGSPSLELRGNAALALAELGDPGGAAVLEELVLREPYEAERRADPSRWSKESQVQQSRIQALQALRDLERAPAPEVLQELAEEPDLELRALARDLRAEREGS